MKTFISFIRGINVSGKNRISMPDLKRLCESLGLRNVSTYIQSGNVVFESFEENPMIIGKEIQAGIKNTLGMDVRVIVRDQEELKWILDSNPFIIDRNKDTEKLYVTFLFDIPGDLAISKLAVAVLRYMSPAADGGGSLKGINSSGIRTYRKDGSGSSPLIDSDSRVVNIEDGGGSKYGKVLLKTGPNKGDEFIMYGKEIFLYCQYGYGKTKFSNTYFEKKLGVSATTRNWKTVNALFEIMTQR
jgi:uncharacterized protein (DUF1697 family)